MQADLSFKQVCEKLLTDANYIGEPRNSWTKSLLIPLLVAAALLLLLFVFAYIGGYIEARLKGQIKPKNVSVIKFINDIEVKYIATSALISIFLFGFLLIAVCILPIYIRSNGFTRENYNMTLSYYIEYNETERVIEIADFLNDDYISTLKHGDVVTLKDKSGKDFDVVYDDNCSKVYSDSPYIKVTVRTPIGVSKVLDSLLKENGYSDYDVSELDTIYSLSEIGVSKYQSAYSGKNNIINQEFDIDTTNENSNVNVDIDKNITDKTGDE